MWSMKKEGMKESREMYLKAIFQLSKIRSGNVRNTDIASYLNVTRSSVTRAISSLNSENLTMIDNNGMVCLTEKGKNVAEQIFERYNTIVQFFKKNLDIDESVISKDACQVEHVISDDMYLAMKENIKNI